MTQLEMITGMLDALNVSYNKESCEDGIWVFTCGGDLLFEYNTGRLKEDGDEDKRIMRITDGADDDEDYYYKITKEEEKTIKKFIDIDPIGWALDERAVNINFTSEIPIKDF